MTLLCAPTTVHNKQNDPKPSNQPSGAQPKQHSVHDAIGSKKTFSAAAYRSGLAREGRKQEVGGSFIVYWRTKAPSVPIHPPTGRAPHVNNRVYSLRRRTFSRHTAGNYSAPIAALTVLTQGTLPFIWFEFEPPHDMLLNKSAVLASHWTRDNGERRILAAFNLPTLLCCH